MSKNRKEEPVRAKVVGLWGDPGLTEYYNFDFLSRFLLVQLAPYNQVPCGKDAKSIIKLVLRPRSLWIEKGPTVEQRIDYHGNRNTQLRNGANPPNAGKNAANYSLSNINVISKSYQVGDELTLTRLKDPVCLGHAPSTSSAAQTTFSNLAANRFFDGKDVFSSLDTFVAMSFMSTDYKNSSGDPSVAAAIIHSYIQGTVASALQIAINRGPNASDAGFQQDAYLACFQKVLRNSTKYKNFFIASGTTASKIINAVLVLHRGSLFKRFRFPSIEYLDSNVDGRKRSDDSGCLPLIVASPSTFPTPISRNLGGVNITL